MHTTIAWIVRRARCGLCSFGLLAGAPIVLVPTLKAQVPAGYTLVFDDEFNASAVDTSVWQYRTDGKDLSQQLAANVSESGGYLHLAVKQQTSGSYSYTGGGLITRAGFGYGYYEASVEVPPGAGWHTSFWAQAYDGSGTGTSRADQELDFMEQDSGNLTHYTANYHFWPTNYSTGATITAPNMNTGFNTIGCLYTPSGTTYYLNGTQVEFINTSAYASNAANIWLTAIATATPNNGLLPSEALVDWVHYYAPPTGATVVQDDADGAGVTITGAWTSSTYNTGYYATDYLQDGDTGGGKTVKFTPTIPNTGTYKVYARWAAAANRATNTTFAVNHNGTVTDVAENQQANGGAWVLLGTWAMNSGTGNSVTVSDTGANGYVIADAVEFVQQ